MKERMGWILSHSKKVYGIGEGFDFESPQEELRYKKQYKKKNLPWRWKLSKPITAGPQKYRLLFAWRGEVFGECEATVTDKVEVYPDDLMKYNLAFKLNGFKWAKKPVKMSAMKVRPYHSLRVLTQERLDAYHRLAKA